MKEIDLKNIYSISLRLFTIIKEEYGIYLSDEKKKFLDDLDIFHFYKIIKGKKYSPFKYVGGIYYLNSSYDIDYLNYLPFICLSCLCGELNPLKNGLIEEELKYLNEKYLLNYQGIYNKEREVSEVVSRTLLDDLPFKIIFLDTDTEIVSYLVEEKGSKVGLLYSELSKKMRKDEKKQDYGDVLDYLYEYLSSKIR